MKVPRLYPEGVSGGRTRADAAPRHRRSGTSDRGHPRDHWMPAAVHAAAPAIAQIAAAVSKPSATTVLSMLEAVTQTGVESDAGSVIVLSAGSTVVAFTIPADGVSPANRIVASATASPASL